MEANLMKFVNGLVMKIHPLYGWSSYEKGQRLALLAIDMDASLIVEVGVFGGRSLLPMALGCQFKGSGTVYGIDPWSKDAALEGKNESENNEWWGNVVDLELIYNSFTKAVEKHSLGDFCKWHRMKSSDAVNLFNDESVDILHIDGNHSEKCSTLDVENWAPKMKLKSAIIMDDTQWPSTQKALKLVESYGFKIDQEHLNWRVYKRS
jgi:hypothetical protein